MQKLLPLICAALALAACTQKPKEIAAPTQQSEVPKERSEPIFYNGKTYQLHYVQNAEGNYVMTVKGMTSKQQPDAIAVTSSSLRYFACKDSQVVQVLGRPSYGDGAWKLTAACG